MHAARDAAAEWTNIKAATEGGVRVGNKFSRDGMRRIHAGDAIPWSQRQP